VGRSVTVSMTPPALSGWKSTLRVMIIVVSVVVASMHTRVITDVEIFEGLPRITLAERHDFDPLEHYASGVASRPDYARAMKGQ
jgi:hypothetical protein